MPRVFISHSSKDKPAVEKLAAELGQRGIDSWVDKWEIEAGADLVDRINDGLQNADAGIVVFSSADSVDRPWVRKEISYLTWANIEEGKPLIPVSSGPGADVPPLLRSQLRRDITEYDAIADAVRNRNSAKPPVNRSWGRVHRVGIALNRDTADGAIHSTVSIGADLTFGPGRFADMARLTQAQQVFRNGFRFGRSPVAAARVQLEAGMAELGRLLATVCLPAGSGDALLELVEGCKNGALVEVCIEAESAELLGLPFEAILLPDGKLLATQPTVVMMRRPAGVPAPAVEAAAGPLKILVAVAAPDEGQSAGVDLDHERELSNLLDAVDGERAKGNAEVRILEAGNQDEIANALSSDAYHVLHLSCHGLPGALVLENEDGVAVHVDAEAFVERIKQSGRHLPLVLLSSCHGGVQRESAASFAEVLLRAGVPCVVAMQTTVSDHYATRLAATFYRKLAERETHLPSRALADARKELEQARQRAVQTGNAPLHEVQPEYATAGLFVSGEERPIANFGLQPEPLRARPIRAVAGPVPQLGLDELIGRRKELRTAMRALLGKSRGGVVLTGIGGVGKSTLAGRAMQRLAERGFAIAAHTGRFDLERIAVRVAAQLPPSSELAQALGTQGIPELLKFEYLKKSLAESRVVLVLDDFEQNLTTGGGQFRSPDVEAFVGELAQEAREGRLLITSRYPVPGLDAELHHVPLGPLSRAETRKLLLRLPALRRQDAEEIARAVRLIGGHPRMLEFLDAVLAQGEGRLPHLTKKVQKLADQEHIDLSDPVLALSDAVQTAIALGMRDVFLAELVAIAAAEGVDEVLLQVAVSNLPVSTDGVARMLGDGETPGAAESAVRAALERLEELSLVYRTPDGGALVHRWTAEGLAQLVGGESTRRRCERAGRYRLWQVANESHELGDAIEAMRNFLAGSKFDDAAGVAHACFDALRRFQQSLGIAALASEILETLPEDHSDFASIADEEAQAHLAMGNTAKALRRYAGLLERHQKLAAGEPDRADYQRELSVSYERVGDMYRALGHGEEARVAFAAALAVRKKLVTAEPGRADYQRDLSVSYNKMGDLYGALGQGEQARAAYAASLAIAQTLAAAEPDRADYQRVLSVSYERMGDLYRALRQGEQARAAFAASLAIREKLAAAEPDRADYQRDLSVSYDKMGALYRALGQGEQARAAYAASLAIALKLATAEPDRADYQSDLKTSYQRLGDLSSSSGEAEQALEYRRQELAIAMKLADAEPERADYQVNLVNSLMRIAQTPGVNPRPAVLKALEILEGLAGRQALPLSHQDLLAHLRSISGQLTSDE